MAQTDGGLARSWNNFTNAFRLAMDSIGSESFLVAQIAATGRLSRREYFEKIKRNKPIRTDDARYVEAFAGDRILYSPYRRHISDVRRENMICEDSSILGSAAAMADIRDIGVV